MHCAVADQESISSELHTVTYREELVRVCVTVCVGGGKEREGGREEHFSTSLLTLVKKY